MEVAVTAATGPGIIVACAGIGFHPTPARVYRSVDGGRSWQRLAGLVLEDSVGSVSVAPDGTILVSGLYSGVVMSGDGGQSWHPVPAVDDSEAVQGGGIITAGMVTNQLGFAVVTGDAFWLTHDGGRTWTAVTVKPPLGQQGSLGRQGRAAPASAACRHPLSTAARPKQ